MSHVKRLAAYTFYVPTNIVKCDTLYPLHFTLEDHLPRFTPFPLFCACHFAPMKDTWHGVAGSPKGIAKLLTVSESGRLRSPPLVEKFRRTKENMLQSLQNQPTNNKLMSLERMFHEVTPRCSCPKLYLMQPLLCRTQIHT